MPVSKNIKYRKQINQLKLPFVIAPRINLLYDPKNSTDSNSKYLKYLTEFYIRLHIYIIEKRLVI